ncbi:hypothetical protein B296_00035028 [Ensete ventricosum]|uniref:Uncharacterized protein n=1 Tax=Ensete ventricosum TaxID=4639 RepID=A0A426XLS7_ENSVE|nr:hypothetical protein B296_00035028 [Ensete ventricosum]
MEASSWSEDDEVENSLGVCQELTEGIRSFLGWHKGVRWKTETRRKIIGGSRKAYRETSPKVQVVIRKVKEITFSVFPEAELPVSSGYTIAAQVFE